MPDYRVKWEIELSAESVASATLEALETMRDPGSHATYFEVFNAAGQRLGSVDMINRALSDWQQEVANGNTVLGYRDWVQHMWEAEQG